MLVFLLLCICSCTQATPPARGSYKVSQAKVHVGGYVADGGQIQNGYIWYPTPKSATEKFPFLIFMHGMTAGGDETPLAYGTMASDVASWGFIVAGPESCRSAYCDDFYADGIHTLLTMKKNTSIHSSLKTADFSTTGVFGHSMGGDATVHLSNNPGGANFKAGVALHPSTMVEDFSTGVTIPLWYATGSRDTVVPPAGVVRSYDRDRHKPKVIAEITGAAHNEPVTGNPMRWTPYIAKYLICHVKGDKNACPYIYEKGSDSLCGNAKIKMTKCETA